MHSTDVISSSINGVRNQIQNEITHMEKNEEDQETNAQVYAHKWDTENYETDEDIVEMVNNRVSRLYNIFNRYSSNEKNDAADTAAEVSLNTATAKSFTRD